VEILLFYAESHDSLRYLRVLPDSFYTSEKRYIETDTNTGSAKKMYTHFNERKLYVV